MWGRNSAGPQRHTRLHTMLKHTMWQGGSLASPAVSPALHHVCCAQVHQRMAVRCVLAAAASRRELAGLLLAVRLHRQALWIDHPHTPPLYPLHHRQLCHCRACVDTESVSNRSTSQWNGEVRVLTLCACPTLSASHLVLASQQCIPLLEGHQRLLRGGHDAARPQVQPAGVDLDTNKHSTMVKVSA